MNVIGVKFLLGGKIKFKGQKYSNLSGVEGRIVGMNFLNPYDITSPVMYKVLTPPGTTYTFTEQELLNEGDDNVKRTIG